METVRPLIEKFFTRTTSEEWELLKQGKPDNTTKVLLAELFLDILATVSTALLKSQGGSFSTVTQEDVRTSLGDTIKASFAPGGKLESVSLADLTDLVVEEVTDTINSSLSSSLLNVPPEELLLTRVTDPGKLHQMIFIISNMFEKLSTNIKRLYGGKLGQRRSRMTPSQEQSPAESFVSETPSTSTLETTSYSMGSFRPSSDGTDQCKTVEEVIVKEVTHITEPIFDEILDIENIDQNYSVELINAAEAITKPAIEASIEIVTAESNSLNSQKGKSSKESSTGKRRKIKNIFAKTFATSWIFKILTQIKRCFKKKPKVKSRKSIDLLMEDIYALLQTEVRLTAEDETCVFEEVKNFPPDRVLLFTKEVAGLLYMYLTNQTIEPDCPFVVPESNTELYSDILKKVSCFLSIMSWFVNKQVDSHTNRVMAACRSSPVAPEIPEVSEPENKKDEVRKRRANELTDLQKNMYVRILVNQIVTKTHTKTKVAITSSSVAEIIENLFTNTLTELGDFDLVLTTENITKLYRTIYKDLSKKWNRPELLLVAMRMKEPEVEQCIASSLKRQLSRGAICKFFME
ncbi:unnamed protein product [Pleuronectes platessa]|uniref:Uncharacterized protein n=1 Tax=Pleuronectes platessa TaxID=8262 RepID=A0A9N7ZA53_PLEPL|nr:unnamed protein product [Pleuronectes platessa]